MQPRTVYAGGSRLLRQWLCRPLRSIKDINDRLDAADEILQRGVLVWPLRRLLRGNAGVAQFYDNLPYRQVACSPI